jgi:hypothetical protein
MSRPRWLPVGLLALVAFAVLPPTAANATWTTSGNGTAAANAARLAGTTGVTTGSATCNGNRRATLPVSWSAVTAAGSYDIQWADNTAFTGATLVSSTSTSTTLQLTGLNNGSQAPSQFYLRVRAKRSAWLGSYSTTTSFQAGPC